MLVIIPQNIIILIEFIIIYEESSLFSNFALYKICSAYLYINFSRWSVRILHKPCQYGYQNISFKAIMHYKINAKQNK